MEEERGFVSRWLELFLEDLEEAGENVEELGAGSLGEVNVGKGGAVFAKELDQLVW